MKNLKCPETIQDVKPEHNEWIAINVLGWVKQAYWNWYDKDGNFMGCDFFPFSDIQHAKMLDEWIVKENLDLEVHFKPNKENRDYFCAVYGRDIEKYEWSESEAFARTCAVYKAYLELNK